MWGTVSGFIRRNPVVFSALLGGAVPVGVVVVLIWWWASSDDDNGDSDTPAAEVQGALITPSSAILIYADNPQVFAVTVTMSAAVSGDKSFDVSIEEIGDIDTELDKVDVTIKNGTTSAAAMFVPKCAVTHPYALIGDKGQEEDESSVKIRPTVDDGSSSGFEGGTVGIDCIEGTHPGTTIGSVFTGDELLEVPGYNELIDELMEGAGQAKSNQ